MYPADLVMPMKHELTDKGFEDLTTAEAVNQAIKKHVSLDKISMVKGGDFANKLKKP